MNPEIEVFKSNYPNLSLRSADDDDSYPWNFSGIRGNEELEFSMEDKEDVAITEAINLSEITMLKNVYGLIHGQDLYVMLRSLQNTPVVATRRGLFRKPFTASMSFKHYRFEIGIFGRDNDYFKLLYLITTAIGHAVIRIRCNNDGQIDEVRDELDDILNSILFDMDYNFGMTLEPSKIGSWRNEGWIRRPRATWETANPVALSFKRYVPELIEYFRIASQISYLPHQYLTYYHIIEYFSDKSAYLHAQRLLKSYFEKPDFSLHIDKYVERTVNQLRLEADRTRGDSYKIQRVVMQFVNLEEFVSQFGESTFPEHFTEPASFQMNDKELKLQKVDMSSEGKLWESSASRIYKLRCSIVHSNPDYDEKKAIPFIPTSENMRKLSKELWLIRSVATMVLLNSTSPTW